MRIMKLNLFSRSDFVFSMLQAIPLLLAIGGISAQCLTGNDNPTMMDPTSKIAFIDARYAFALDSLRKAAIIETQDNLFFSPHSLHQAISLAYFGARGTTESALKQALRFPDDLSKVDVQRYSAYETSFNQPHDTQVRLTARANCATVASPGVSRRESWFIVASTISKKRSSRF